MSKIRKVRIVNTDGQPHHTEILDAETGEMIQGVTSADIHLERNELRITLQMTVSPFDVVGTATVVHNHEEIHATIKVLEKRLAELRKMLEE